MVVNLANPQGFRDALYGRASRVGKAVCARVWIALGARSRPSWIEPSPTPAGSTDFAVRSHPAALMTLQSRGPGSESVPDPSAPNRVELLELPCQGPRTVESLAEQAGVSLANASQRLQVLGASRLVETEKQRSYVECKRDA